MKYYCSKCGRDLNGLAFNDGKHSYHRKCIPVRAPKVHNSYVKHINENKITSDMKDLESRLQMLNDPQPHLVRVK